MRLLPWMLGIALLKAGVARGASCAVVRAGQSAGPSTASVTARGLSIMVVSCLGIAVDGGNGSVARSFQNSPCAGRADRARAPSPNAGQSGAIAMTGGAQNGSPPRLGAAMRVAAARWAAVVPIKF